MPLLPPLATALLLTALALPVLAAAPAGPAFDCARAEGDVQALICRDAELAALDQRMAVVFKQALANWAPDTAKARRALQRGWVKGRDECWKVEDLHACTLFSYRSRILELQITSGQLEAPRPIRYACTGGEGAPFTATFHGETDPASAVLTQSDDQMLVFAKATVSGLHYSAPNVSVREHQGGIIVERFGTTLDCRQLPDAPPVQ